MNNSPALYGAWISPKGDFIPVAEECHAEKAMELLHAKHDTKIYSIYRVMYRLGYVRVIYMKEGAGVEYWDKLHPSKFQQEIINTAEYKEKINIYYNQKVNTVSIL